MERAYVAETALLISGARGHLVPTVPTCHLPQLSRRLEGAAPEYKDLTVY